MDGMVNSGGAWSLNSSAGGRKAKSEEFWARDKASDSGPARAINTRKRKTHRLNLDDDDNSIETLDNDGFSVLELIRRRP
jgi:hypothetical protein